MTRDLVLKVRKQNAAAQQNGTNQASRPSTTGASNKPKRKSKTKYAGAAVNRNAGQSGSTAKQTIKGK